VHCTAVLSAVRSPLRNAFVYSVVTGASDSDSDSDLRSLGAATVSGDVASIEAGVFVRWAEAAAVALRVCDLEGGVTSENLSMTMPREQERADGDSLSAGQQARWRLRCWAGAIAAAVASAGFGVYSGELGTFSGRNDGRDGWRGCFRAIVSRSSSVGLDVPSALLAAAHCSEDMPNTNTGVMAAASVSQGSSEGARTATVGRRTALWDGGDQDE